MNFSLLCPQAKRKIMGLQTKRRNCFPRIIKVVEIDLRLQSPLAVRFCQHIQRSQVKSCQFSLPRQNQASDSHFPTFHGLRNLHGENLLVIGKTMHLAFQVYCRVLLLMRKKRQGLMLCRNVIVKSRTWKEMQNWKTQSVKQKQRPGKNRKQIKRTEFRIKN